MSETPIREVLVDSVSFLREQDGMTERVLKQELILLFAREHDVKTAYLAQATTGSDGSIGVALCIRLTGPTNMDLVRRVQRIFARIFSRDAELDIVFLGGSQLEQIGDVCLPFYSV